MEQQQQKYPAVKSAKKPRGKPFEPGNRANPSGRPKGSRCLALRALDQIGDENAKAVLQAVIKKQSVAMPVPQKSCCLDAGQCRQQN
jgi:hypothetical protein